MANKFQVSRYMDVESLEEGLDFWGTNYDVVSVMVDDGVFIVVFQLQE
jgi:hypothetical protein